MTTSMTEQLKEMTMKNRSIEKELNKICAQACKHLDQHVSVALNKHGKANLKRLVRKLVLPLEDLIPHVNAVVGKTDAEEWLASLIQAAHIHSYQRLIGNTNEISAEIKREVLEDWAQQIEQNIGIKSFSDISDEEIPYTVRNKISRVLNNYLDKKFESVFLPSVTLQHVGDGSQVWLGQTMMAIHMLAVQKALEQLVTK